MSRAALSKPITMALNDQLLRPSNSIFDFGCGRGDDVRHLAALGYDVDGWDPSHRPFTKPVEADIVNLGYVVNVIEQPQERAETLCKAWDLTRRMMIVSSRLNWDARNLTGRPVSDGLVTSKGTFQKLYEQSELSNWIETTLGVQAHAAAPGIFYVFRDPAVAQEFLATRVRTYRPRMRIDPHELYEANQDVVAPLFTFMNEHARPPHGTELAIEETEAITQTFGSISRAIRLIRSITDGDYWDKVVIQRRAELLIYVALSRFGRRPRFSQLGPTLSRDIRVLFGNYQSACTQADRLLLACGDPSMVLVTARSSKVGKQTPSSLYVHRTALGELPPLLQVYEGCARVLSGTVENANMIKLSVTQPQVSYLSYPNFDRDPHPALAGAITVNLQKLTVDYRDYRSSENPPLLHRKEEFISSDHPQRQLFARLTKAEYRAGLYEHPETIGTLKGWRGALAQAGVTLRGHKLVDSDRGSKRL